MYNIRALMRFALEGKKMSLSDIIKYADEGLYKAKNQGRSRVVAGARN